MITSNDKISLIETSLESGEEPQEGPLPQKPWREKGFDRDRIKLEFRNWSAPLSLEPVSRNEHCNPSEICHAKCR